MAIGPMNAFGWYVCVEYIYNGMAIGPMNAFGWYVC